MKKKLLIFILFLFLIPKVSYAFNCTTTGITGAAGGRGSPQGNVGSCGGAKTCLLSYPGHGSLAFAGVRIQIYKYTGSGSPQLVGSGVDIWATNSEAAWKYYNGHFTSPLRANLRYKANCSPYSTNIDSVFSVSQSSYFSGNSYNVEQSDSLKQAFNSQTHGGKNDVAEFVLQHNAGTPTSGYVKQYFLDYLINGDIDNLTTSNYSINRFRLSEKEVSDMQTTPDDYYITAEILYRFIYSDKVYYGTVSEGEYFFWPCGKKYGWTYDDGSYADYSLYSLNETVGSILSKNNSGKHIIDIWLGSNNTTKPSCSVAKGWAVWNLHEVCEECGSSCQKDCEQYSKGSFQHQLCAQGYCETNEKDDVAGCVNKCTYVDKDEGCNGECKVSKNSSGSLQCSNSPGTAELEAQSCHDDNTSYTVIDNELDVNYSSSGKYSYSSLKYYKIDCTEKFKLRDLPTRDSNAWLTKTDVGTLHLGFTLDYNKKCEIKYKIGISNDKGSVSYDWQSDFKNSRLQNDIIDTKKAIDNSNKAIAELQEELKTAQTEKKKELIQESIESYKNIIEVAKKTFEELMELAPTSFSYNGKTGGGVIDARLILLTQQDHKGQNYLEPTIELQTPGAEASYNGSYSETVDHLVLEPVACRETPQTTTTTSVEYCAWREDLQKYTTRTTTTTTTNTLFECDKVDANGNSVPVKAKVADNKYSATLSKTLYYELPDSYVLTQSEEDGLVFHSTFKNDVDIDFKSAEAQCNDYLKRQSYTGKCLKKDNLYQFPQFKDKLIVDTITSRNKKFNYTIKINNMGYCGEKLGGYTYSCSYQFKEDTECVKCSQYTKGTAEYNACYEANCSCKAICNGNVACEQKYCPTNCVSCGDSTSYYEDVDCDDPGNPPTCDDPPCPPVSDTCDPTKSDCCNDECSKNYVAGTDALSMCQYECCSKNANGNIQALTNCCHRYCEKTSGGSNNDKYNECVQTWCDCPECEGGLNFVYRSIDINDPFNGREKEKDGVGLNWRGKIGYITEENNSKNKQYYDSTNSTVKNEITSEYIVDLSSDMIKSVKKNREIGGVEANTTYTTTNESKTTHSKVGANNSEETVDPYCSYLLHDVLETNGVLKQNDTAGMRCK